MDISIKYIKGGASIYMITFVIEDDVPCFMFKLKIRIIRKKE